MTKQEFICKLADRIPKIEGCDFKKDGDSIRIWLNPYTGLGLHIVFKDEEGPVVYYYIRTASWYYTGERTDLHDTFSVAFSVFLMILQDVSGKLIYVANPATEADNEIYSIYYILTQSSHELNFFEEDSIDKYLEIVTYFMFFGDCFLSFFGSCPCDDCRSRLDEVFEYRCEIDANQENLFKKAVKNRNEYHLNYCERQLPSWIYFRDFKKRITIIKASVLANELFRLISLWEHNEIDGVQGCFFTTQNTKHFISDKTLKSIKRILKSLGTNSDYKIIPSENRVIVVCEEYVIALNDLSGLYEYKVAREHLRIRHQKESSILFADSKIRWGDRVDDDLFENLAKDLLEREPNVLRVRKISHTNEPDGKRDLIAEIQITDDNYSPAKDVDNKPPTKVIRVIIQCKAYKKGVGKSDVTDIRDTLEFNDCQGFFLIVSSYTKRTLTDHLDKLRNKSHLWIDWWTRHEIDEKLQKNPELINKYSTFLSRDLSVN